MYILHDVCIYIFYLWLQVFAWSTLRLGFGAFEIQIWGLGVNHEQKRADGSQQYHGKGPHLEMFWENTESWGSQYTPAVNTYIGSADDGGADPQIGYAPYDFDTRQNRNPRPAQVRQFQIMVFAWFGKKAMYKIINCGYFHGCLNLRVPYILDHGAAESSKCFFVWRRALCTTFDSEMPTTLSTTVAQSH